MNSPNPGVVVAGLAAVGVSACVGYVVYRSINGVPVLPDVLQAVGSVRRTMSGPSFVGGRYTEEFLKKWMRDANEVQFTRVPWSASRFGGVGSGLRVLATRDRGPIAPRAGTRVLPLVAPLQTKLVPGGFDRMTKAGRTAYLAAIRTVLMSAGRADIDPRVIMCLWANESNWDRATWGWNFGNVKSQGKLEADSFEAMVASQSVRAVSATASGVCVFQDGLNSVDGYFSFASSVEGARHSIRAIENTRGANADAVLGGSEGAQAFARALSNGGWSPEPAEARAAAYAGFWRACTRIMGDTFVR